MKSLTLSKPKKKRLKSCHLVKNALMNQKPKATYERMIDVLGGQMFENPFGKQKDFYCSS